MGGGKRKFFCIRSRLYDVCFNLFLDLVHVDVCVRSYCIGIRCRFWCLCCSRYGNGSGGFTIARESCSRYGRMAYVPGSPTNDCYADCWTSTGHSKEKLWDSRCLRCGLWEGCSILCPRYHLCDKVAEN